MYVRYQKHAQKQHGCIPKPHPLKVIRMLNEKVHAEADHNTFFWSIRGWARRKSIRDQSRRLLDRNVGGGAN